MTDIINYEVKDNKPHIEHKNIVQQLKKKFVPTSLEEIRRANNAGDNAHTIGSDKKREISMEIKNKLSDIFEFIEESCGSGAPEFEFFDAPQSQTVHEGMEGCAVVANKYPIIGKASGVFAPIGVMSRNNRIYDEDHYDYLFTNQQLVDRIAHRGMLGTIGHHDKKVDDQDLAEGKVSHIVSDLHIQEEADGTRNLYGTLEILDTPAGHLLKTYYDSGIPLFVSSRGGGNLLPVPHESYKRVDKTKYFLETFDIVKNPGFLQAKPVYEKVSEGAEEIQEAEPIKEEKEENMDKLDKLTEALTNFVNSITEAKKEDKAEDNETKEAKEKKEAKEAKEAKIEEAEEDKEDIKVGKDEDKKDKEEKTPEDEKKEEAEDAIADTVSEEEKKQELSKTAEKLVKKVLDPQSNMTDADKANGYIQTKIINPEQAHSFGVGYDKAKAERKAMAKEIREKAKANSKPSTSKPKEEDKQLHLFCSKEELANKLRSAIADYNSNEELEKDGPKGEVKSLKSAPKTGYFDKKIETAKTNFRTKDKVARNAWKNFNPDDIDYSGYSDSYANAMTADDERQEALDNYKYTRDKMNAERKGKAINPKRTHMNDKNSKIEQAKGKKENIKEEVEAQLLEQSMSEGEISERNSLLAAERALSGASKDARDAEKKGDMKSYNKAIQKYHKEMAEVQRLTPKINVFQANSKKKEDEINDKNSKIEQAKGKKENIKEEVEAQLLKQSMDEGYNLQSVVDRAEKLAKTGTLKNGETYSHAAVNNDIQRQKRRKEILSNDDKRHTASYVPDSYMYKRGKISGKVEKDDIFTTTNQKHGSADELAMQRHSSETLKNKAIGRYCKKMNDKNSKIEQALKTIAEADQMLAQPVAPVQTGEIYKNAQDAENKPELPTTFDHQDLARALKANYKKHQRGK